MTEENPIVQQYHTLRTRFQTLRDQADLSDLQREVADLTTKVGTLPADISRIRTRGYAFAAYLEQKAEVLAQQWAAVADEVKRELAAHQRRLRGELSQVEQTVEKADAFAHKPDFLASRMDELERALGDAEGMVKAAVDAVSGLFATLRSDIYGTFSQLDQINGYMDQRDEASFAFLAGEAVFLTAKAEWVVSGKGGQDPDGILFLTDQRLIFEQKEKTGKRLGLFGGKNTQEVEWEIPLHQIEKVEAENKGFFGGKDMLYFTLGAGAPHAQLTLEVKGGVNCKFWRDQINRMISGGTQDERAIAPDPELIEALRNAPAACNICGGTLPRLVAGQTQITCAFCGSVIRI